MMTAIRAILKCHSLEETRFYVSLEILLAPLVIPTQIIGEISFLEKVEDEHIFEESKQHAITQFSMRTT